MIIFSIFCSNLTQFWYTNNNFSIPIFEKNLMILHVLPKLLKKKSSIFVEIFATQLQLILIKWQLYVTSKKFPDKGVFPFEKGVKKIAFFP